MSVQGEINRSLGLAAASASVAEGLKVARAKEERESKQEAERAAKEKKTAERQELLFQEQSYNKIKGQEKAISEIDAKLSELDPVIKSTEGEAKRLANLRNQGGKRRAEALASLDDLLSQRKSWLADKAQREAFVRRRQKLLDESLEVTSDGEE